MRELIFLREIVCFWLFSLPAVAATSNVSAALVKIKTAKISKPYWTYEGARGVSNWYQHYPKCEVGPSSSQSPIDIVDTTLRFQNIQPIVFQGYSEIQGVTWELSNNGHTVEANLASGDLRISGGGFSDTYIVAQFHFHWGSSSTQGSEHLINGKAYPLELHIVHYGMRFGSLSEAAVQPNGLAVLGFMFEVSDKDNTALNSIVNTLVNINAPSNKSSVPPMALRNLLPNSLTSFYRYSGSLTTPGCYESVAWTVFTSTIPISEAQLQKFRDVLSSDRDQATNQYKPLVDNFRPVQPINNRVVYANFKLDPDATTGLKANFITCVVCLLLVIISSM